MKIDTIIRNGHVIDPSQKLNEVRTIGIDNGRIVDVTEDMTAVTEINAEGCYVFPGLIDFHVHAFGDASGWGVDSKDMFLATGVTSICDQGSAGKTNYEAFHKTVVEPGLVRVRSFLNIYNGGTLDMGFDEILDSKRFDVKGIRKVLDKYHDEILGIKIRLSKAITGQYGYEPFPKTVSIARELGLPVCIHITDPPCRQAEIADLFQAGDIMCHCFHGRGETILGKDGKIDPAIWAARERGVIFDVAHGHTNFSFRIIRQALIVSV